jgi:hypothetical protein
MSSNATTDANIRALPLYRLGWSDGHDLGLRQALDAITARAGQARAGTDQGSALT